MIELNVLSMYQLSNCLFIFLISFLTTIILVPFFISIAIKYNIVDKPDGRLKKQKNSIPYLGGLTIFCGFSITNLIFNSKIIILDYYFTVGIFFLLILGLIDDLIELKPLTKFIGQILASLFFLLSLLNSGFILSIYFVPIILLWFLSLINAFNFIDVMDGLATTVAIFATISLTFFCLIHENLDLALLLVSFLGALMGFLYYNKPPAKIYLGDTGSLFIGGFLAYVGFFIKKNNIICEKNSLIPIFIFAVPILELIGLILIRFYKKIPFYLGSPDHFSIYLQQKGWSKINILLLISILSTILFFISLLIFFNYLNIILLLLFTSIFLVAWSFLIF